MKCHVRQNYVFGMLGDLKLRDLWPKRCWNQWFSFVTWHSKLPWRSRHSKRDVSSRTYVFSRNRISRGLACRMWLGKHPVAFPPSTSLLTLFIVVKRRELGKRCHDNHWRWPCNVIGTWCFPQCARWYIAISTVTFLKLASVWFWSRTFLIIEAGGFKADKKKSKPDWIGLSSQAQIASQWRSS